MKTSAIISAIALFQGVSSAKTITDTFTYSGRSMMWTASIDDARDTSIAQPAYFLFPGTVDGTPAQFLQACSPSAGDFNRTRAGYTFTLSPPDYCASPNQTMRCWTSGKDDSVVLAAIRTGFNHKIKLDTNKLVLHGRSAGTCFLNPFLQNNRIGWKGGIFLECGCHSDYFDRVPDPNFAKGFRIYIATTNDDFLRRGSLTAVDYFKYWAQYDLRWNINSAGGHCASPSPVYDSASQWLTGTNFAAPPAEQHWERLLPLTGIKSVAVSTKGIFWLARSGSNKSEVWRSADAGATWTQPYSKSDSLDPTTGKVKIGLGGLALLGEVAVVSHRDSLVIIDTNNIKRSIPGTTAVLNSDSIGRLWRGIGAPSYSVDTGRTWKSIPTGVELANQLSRSGFAGKTLSLLFQRKLPNSSYPNFAITWNGTTKDTSSYPLPDSTLAWTRRADTFLVSQWDGKAQKLLRKVVMSPDTSKWTAVTWPTDALSRSPATTKSPAVQPEWNPVGGKWMVFGAPSYQADKIGSWSRMAGIWMTDAYDPGAFVPFGGGKMLRTAKDGNGLLVWTLNGTVTPPTAVQPESPSKSGHLAQRKGMFLELSGSDQTKYALHWMNALGRSLGSRTAIGGQRVSILPPDGGSGPAWVEIRSADGAEIHSLAW